MKSVCVVSLRGLQVHYRQVRSISKCLYTGWSDVIETRPPCWRYK